MRTRSRGGGYPELAAEAGGRRAERALLRLLYNEEAEIRLKAAIGLGIVVSRAPGRARPLVDRLWWTLNDEAGMFCPGAPLAIAYIALAQPELVRPVVSPLVHLLDDEGQVAAVLQAIALLAPVFPDAVADLGPALTQLAQEGHPAVRDLAREALGRFGAAVGRHSAGAASR